MLPQKVSNLNPFPHPNLNGPFDQTLTMARVVDVIGSDDDLPELHVLLDSMKRDSVTRLKSTTPPSQALSAKTSSRPKADLTYLEEADSGRGENNAPACLLAEKQKPKRRLLNNKADNPLLKPLTSSSGNDRKPKLPLPKMNAHSGSTQKATLAVMSKELKVVRVLDSDEKMFKVEKIVTSKKQVRESWKSKGTAASLPVPYSGLENATGCELVVQAKTKKASRTDSGNGPSETTSKKKPKSLSSDATRKIDDEMDEQDGNISDFIISDCTVLDEESLGSPMPPPRSVRRLVKGRRPDRLDTSDDDSLLQEEKGRARDTSGVLRSGREPPLLVTSKNDHFSRSQLRVKRSTLEEAQEELVLEVGGLSLKHNPSNNLLMEEGFRTPPGSPLLKPIKLKSPTKKFLQVPTSPHRPSMDSFWNSEVVNDWNDEYSPQKPLKSYRLDENNLKESTLSFSPRKSPVKTARTIRDAKKTFSEKKYAVAEAFLAELDEAIAQGQISKHCASTGGVKIIWSRKLNTTAGRANWKRETIKSTNLQNPNVTHRHHASIELAEKVIDDEGRLLNVIAHEFCHLANFMISNIKTNPHGKEFKEWAAKCSRRFGSRGIEVTTKHTYEIDYKYVWECDSCGMEFKRHSKSINPAKHQCGSCKSKLVQTKPVPRVGTASSAVKKVNEYQTFVKENMSKVREENPGSPQKDMLGLVAKRYQELKATKTKTSTARSTAARGESGKETALEDFDIVTRRLDFLDLTSP